MRLLDKIIRNIIAFFMGGLIFIGIVVRVIMHK